ncbi:hypothetical protein QAD02_010578 [Eretmocerus hayati]|uniref:Uncharacterized protein n=1 Tax=Eretmocerus hayati TaxID=131215 RepID=A0ACC2NUM5_9HYME|nr:hypothetical protein QAD02_010578 [Eretmocerus hayati]
MTHTIVFLLITLICLNESSMDLLREHVHLNWCSVNKSINVQITSNDELNCQCQATRVLDGANEKDGYIHTPGIGSHKLHAEAKSWNDARKICSEENAHLAIINSRAEEAVLVGILKNERKHIRKANNKEEAFLGIHDMFKEGEWVTVFGEPLHLTGYEGWSPTYWGGQPDNKDKNQNCGALIYLGGMDDVHCHSNFAFFCELPLQCT